jgi:hypothetical protein
MGNVQTTSSGTGDAAALLPLLLHNDDLAGCTKLQRCFGKLALRE